MTGPAPTEKYCKAGLKFFSPLPTIMAEAEFLTRGQR